MRGGNPYRGVRQANYAIRGGSRKRRDKGSSNDECGYGCAIVTILLVMIIVGIISH